LYFVISLRREIARNASDGKSEAPA
jgi:hypothetical protein